MQIKVIQYLRPHGEPKALTVEIPDKFKNVIAKLDELDLRITCEQLTNGLVAQCISHKKGDFTIELTLPGEPTHAKLLEMLDNFNEEAFKSWLELLRK